MKRFICLAFAMLFCVAVRCQYVPVSPRIAYVYRPLPVYVHHVDERTAAGVSLLVAGLSINALTGMYYWRYQCYPGARRNAIIGVSVGTSFSIAGIILLATRPGYHRTAIRNRHWKSTWREY